MKQVALVVLAASASLASADPPVATSKEPPKPGPAEPAPEAPPVPQAPQPDANDVSGAPLPGNESGRIDPGEPGDSAGRQGARVVLFIPKVLFEIAMLPFDGIFYLEGKYQLEDWYNRIFYYRDKTLGIIPTATYVTGLGFTAGVRFFDLDTFGRREKLVLQATTGGQFRLGFLASMDTGDRLGPLRIEVSGNFDRRPAEPFYGIGNDGTLQETGSNIDAFTDPTAVETFYRYQEARVAALADLSVISHLHLDLRGQLAQLEYTHGTHEFPSIDDVYDPDSLVGFGTTTNRLYGELELRWDDRKPTSVWEPSTVHGSGTFASLYGGISHPISADDGVDFWHYGTDLQHYIRLGFGPRVLIARFHEEAVSGEVNDIPLSELPELGGAWFLRGYPYERFRDMIAIEASLQYMWSLTANTSAFVFTDVGRVYHDWNEFTLDDLHAGFGLGLEVYMPPSFLADLSLATSSNGGIAVTAEFSPVLDARPRWR